MGFGVWGLGFRVQGLGFIGFEEKRPCRSVLESSSGLKLITFTVFQTGFVCRYTIRGFGFSVEAFSLGRGSLTQAGVLQHRACISFRISSSSSSSGSCLRRVDRGWPAKEHPLARVSEDPLPVANELFDIGL